MGKAALLPYNYPHLQNLIKRDASAYAAEFQQQYQHFRASLAIIQMQPAAADEHFEALVTFLGHVSHCYAESKTDFPPLILALLNEKAAELDPGLRRALVQALLLLRKHGLVELVVLLELFFRLLRLPDKALRDLLYLSIVGEVRRANRPHRNNALNKALQNFIYALLEEAAVERVGSGENAAVNRILHIAIELYRARVWDDARTVNVVAEAAVRRISIKVLMTALNFFVGRFQGKSLLAAPGSGNASDSEEEGADGSRSSYQNLLQRSQHNGTNKRAAQKKLRKALSGMHRKERKQGRLDQNGSFAAIHLLNDPQGFVERLFGHLKRSNDPLEVKLLLINVISRVIGAHKLLLLDFYSFLLRYIQPHQRDVTQILAYAAQATHDELPTDVISPLLTAIAHNFAAEHRGNEVIAAGLNGIREVCARCPGAMSAELLQDLANFKGYNDKGVVIAARSLIALYREIDPTLLDRKDRGKEVSLALKSGTFKKGVSLTSRATYHLDASQIGVASGEVAGGDDDEMMAAISDEEAEVAETDGCDEEEDDGDDKASCDDGDDDYDEEDVECSSDAAISKDDGELLGTAVRRKEDDLLSIAATRILTPAEFSRLRKRIAGEISSEGSSSEGDAGSASEDSDDGKGTAAPEVVDPQSLQSVKKTKQDYASRLASIQAGREGRRKFGSRMGKHIDKASISNRIKEKRNKNAIMLAHKCSVRAKKRRSLREQQQVQAKHRKRQKMRR